MQRRIWVVTRWLRTTCIKNLLRKQSSGNPKCVKWLKFNVSKYVSYKSIEQNLSLEASSRYVSPKNLCRFMEPEDVLICSHKTATGHYPESLRDKMTLSRFDSFKQLKYLTQQFVVYTLNEPTNRTSVIHYYYAVVISTIKSITQRVQKPKKYIKWQLTYERKHKK